MGERIAGKQDQPSLIIKGHMHVKYGNNPMKTLSQTRLIVCVDAVDALYVSYT